MAEEKKTKVGIKLDHDMIFKCNLGFEKLQEIYIDETLEEKEDLWGPDAARLLGMALLGCLSASFILCLQKRNLELDDLRAEAEIIIAKNEKKLLRVKEINVDLIPESKDPSVLKRIEQCKKFFEQYCTITESVRAGIDVNLNININDGG